MHLLFLATRSRIDGMGAFVPFIVIMAFYLQYSRGAFSAVLGTCSRIPTSSNRLRIREALVPSKQSLRSGIRHGTSFENKNTQSSSMR